MPDRPETDPLAATAMGSDEPAPATTPALDRTLASGEELPPMTGVTAGDRIGRFEILQLLGAGGMGAVFAARDTELRRKVAIKVLRRARAGSQGTAMSARLLREAQAAARLSHRNVVTIYEVGTIDQGAAAGQVFVAMELVDGETLSRWYDRRPGWRDAVRIYLGAARGLAAAHAAGLVHRDFKPDNALLGVDGEVKVMDFGLASVAGERGATAAAPSTPRSSLETAPTRLTSTGDVMGTPLFMAPEQRDGGTIDARADQYAFCVALFQAVYRCYPFGLDSEAVIAKRARAHQIATPKRGRAPRALYRILARGLSPDPGARFPDLPALIHALERVVGVRRRRVVAGAIAGTTITFAAIVVLAGQRNAAVAPCTGAAAELAATWNPEVAARLETAILAHDLPGIDVVGERTDEAFTSWGDAWIAARTATCRATRVDRSQSEEVLDRRMACLEGQRQLLAGAIAALERPDRDTASRAAELALRLPRADECANAAAATKGSEAIRATLRELWLADVAGKFRDQLTPAQQALSDARAVGDHVLEAEAGLQLGRFQRMAGDDAASATLLDAVVAADTALAFDVAVRAWSEWIFVSTMSDVRDEQIQSVYPKAELALDRAGGGPLLTAVLRNNQGVAAYQAGRDADAEKLFRAALRLREAVLGPDNPRVAEVLDNLGNVLGSLANASKSDQAMRTRLLEESLAAGKRGLAIRENRLGTANPAVARSLHNVGSTLYDLGRESEARDHLERALRLKEEVLGEDHPDVGTTLIELSSVEEHAGNLGSAAAMSARAATLWEKTQGRSPTYALSKTGWRYTALGRFQDAIAAYEKAERLSASSVKAGLYRRFANEARIEAGDVEGALAELEDIVATEADAFALGDPKRAPALISLAWAEIAAGRPKDGLHSLTRAEKLFANAKLPPNANVALIAITRAEALVQLGKKTEALALARKAIGCNPDLCGLDLYMIKRRAAKLGVVP